MKEVVVSKPLSEETAADQTDLGAAALLSGPHSAQTSQEASGRELERNVQGGAVVEELVQATGDNDKSHLIRLLADDCVWEVVPWKYRARGRGEVAAFLGAANKTRTYRRPGQRVRIDHWFTDGESGCIELTNITSLSIFPWLGGEQRICLIAHVSDGKVDTIREYFKAPFPVSLVIGMVPLILRLRQRKRSA